MYLKRLELVGFKSFAKRTELSFEPGITAVVGPNGSGKSNIADAIRWVLGEQSAKLLRGGKMEDVIFAGSDARKPVNYCEVSLTLDNGDQMLSIDYSEVTITRRVYRSGESEYYINRQTCRLRDIVELFMDTGVGKEAYSIIGQGKIEEILSAKSEDRRAIFEEAAGIVKFKARKKESEKKLTETEANLDRVRDIMSEISDQLDPLREQAEAAERFLTLRRKRKDLEVSLALHRIERLRDDWNHAKRESDQHRDELAAFSSKLSGLEAQISKQKWDNNEHSDHLECKQQELLRLSEESEKAEGQRQVIEERKKNAMDKYEQIERTKAEQERKLVETRTKLTEQEQLLRQSLLNTDWFAQQLNIKQKQLTEINENLMINVERLQKDYIELLNQNASLENERKHSEQMAETLGQKRAIVIEQLRETEARAAQINVKARQCQEELKQKQTELDHAEALFKKYAEEYEKTSKMKEQEELQLRKMERAVQTIQSRKDILDEMQSSFTGFRQGVKEVLKAKENKLKGIHGAVAELLSVPSEYEIAIEIALGGSLQQIVVANESIAREAIQWLKTQRLGRATFLPLDVIRPRRISPADEIELQKLDGFIGVACDLIHCEPQYRSIYENLLGSVLVMKNLASANAAARRFHYRYRWVSLEGDVVNPGGAMTGGLAREKNGSFLGRSRQIEELEQQLKREQMRKQSQIEQLRRIEMNLRQLTEAREAARRLIEQRRLNIHDVKDRMTRLEMEWSGLSEAENRLRSERDSLSEAIEENERQQTELKNQTKAGDDQQRRLKETLDELGSRRAALEREKEKLGSEITELKIRAAQEEQRQESIQAELQRLTDEMDRMRQETIEARDLLIGLRNEMATLEEQWEESKQSLNQTQAKREQLEVDIERLKKARAESESRLDQLDSDARWIRKQSKQSEEKLHRSEMKASRLEVALDNELDKLFDEFGLSYDTAKETYRRPQDPASAEDELIELKQQIAALGDVNVGAIESYSKQSERYQFLQEQSEDLARAKQTLYQVIDEMEQAISREFTRAFERIRSEFQQVFRHLFGGGRADIYLSDPDQVLHTGIEIIAQPPGKKLQNLALLSGGEKALTAIALLFAIQRIKPVPFCVLDEVEAALDEMNVYRFVQYLREFSGKTQFICITHRKGTMEGADALYGVTMQESGVSNLVSVKLEEQFNTA